MAGKKLYQLDAHDTIVDTDVVAVSATASWDAEKSTFAAIKTYVLNLLTTASVTASTDKNYVTDAQMTVLWNTSWTNSGDQDLSSYATKTWAETLTNKRITKRVASTATDATAVIDSDSYDEYYLTAMDAATEISVTGTPTEWQTIFIGLKDDWTTRALTWTGITALWVTLPTTTTVSKQHIIWIKYISSAWRAIAVSEEA